MFQLTISKEHQFFYKLDDVQLPGRKVTSLALITNELFSNAMKHGKGSVAVIFTVQENQARLEVYDNGPGFPADFDASTAANTGITLIETMARYDLGARFSMQTSLRVGHGLLCRYRSA